MNEIIEEAVGTLEEVGHLHMLVWARKLLFNERTEFLAKGIPKYSHRQLNRNKAIKQFDFLCELRNLNEKKDEQLCEEKFETLSRNIRKSQTQKQRQMKANQINTPSNEKRSGEKNEIKGDSEKR